MELATSGLYRSFEDFVFHADISAREGELVCLLGPSGCGKTTALQMVAGITRPEKGTIILGGRNITELPPWKRNVGLVFQDYALFPHMTVYENIAYGLRTQHEKESKIRRRVEELLELVHLPDYGGRSPSSLSGGEQQRVALARALAPSPSLLLLDEPLSALDAQLRKRLRREIRSIQKKIGLTTVYVTHDQEEALTMSDRIVLLNNGRVEQEGPPQELYKKPASVFAARFLGSSNLVPQETGGFLFFRPEETRMSREYPNNPPELSEGDSLVVFHLRVQHVEYLGSHYIAEGVGESCVVRATVPPELAEYRPAESGGIEPGEWAYFSVPASKTVNLDTGSLHS